MRPRKIAATMMAGAFLLGACSEAPETTAPAEFAASLSVASNRVARTHVFTMHGSTGGAELASAVAAAGGTVRYSMDDIGVVLVDGLSDAAADKVARGKASVSNDLRGRWIPGVESLKSHLVQADALEPVSAASLQSPLAAAALSLQWNMRVTDTDDAWRQGFTGIPTVKVAILDTGLDAYHQEQFNLIDIPNSIAFEPSKAGPPTWEDDNTHGTYVGSIVTSNNFVVAGVAPNVTLVAVKVLNENGDGNLGNVIAGIYYAANLGVDVINMSLGATFPKNEVQGLVPAFNRAVNYAHSKGVFIVAASGNDGEDLQHNGNRVSVPCETGVLSCISATSRFDTPAVYSNYGTNAINNAAPGGDFSQGGLTAMVVGACSSRSIPLAFCRPPAGSPPGTPGAGYIWAEGTSGAAPHVSALGALLDSQFAGALNGSQILTAIQQNADDLGKPGTDEYFGKGRINTCRTLPGCIPTKPNVP
jgi:subtilisin family serine protease